jgi:hypothetical protein
MRVMARSGVLTPEQQLKVLARIWGEDGEGGFVFLPWIPGWCNSKEDRRRNWNEGPAFEWPQDRNKILAHMADHQTDDLYFSVNVFLQDSRIIQHIGESRVLYADLDEVDPRSDIDPNMQPTIAWESSPNRFQGIWQMSSMEWEASMPGGLNHRLTAAIGADPSGWDATQVLRVPGKPNYKFDYKDEDGRPAPGRLLWVRDKQYKWSFFDGRLPEVKTYDTGIDVEESEVDGIDRHEVWARVRMKCSHTVRNFMGMRARDIDSDEFDRSEVLWQIERDLADAGCTVAEIMAIVRGTPWNKYEGRRNELAQLRAEALKALGVAADDKEEKPLEQAVYDGSRPTLENLPTLAMLTESSIPRPNWLVRKIWTKGSCGFISGQPKSYKSYFGLDLALSVATGTNFLNDPQFATGDPRRVIYIQEEDSLPLVMHRAEQILEGKAPDRHWHGQITLPGGTLEGAPARRSGSEWELDWTPPVPVDSLAMLVRKGFVASDPAWQSWLAEIVIEWGAELVVIDTLGTTVGDIDTDKSVGLNEKVLRPLKAISEQAHTAIAVVHHNRKASDDKARSGQQMLGSVALHAWVESALYVQSKEQITGQPALVKVERENKLAEDMKFRVKVPTMWTAKGEGDGRQLWDPEVLIGWGDAEQKPETDREEYRRTSRAGEKIARAMAEMGGKTRDLPLDRIIEVYGQPAGHVKKQLKDAIGNGLIDGDDTDGYRVL